MGTETIYSRSDGQTVDADDVNQYRLALSGDFVPRTTGAPTDEAGSLGQSNLQWTDVYFSGRLVQDGNVLKTEILQNNPNEITSGKAKTSGYPEFLEIVAASTSGKILGVTTPLQLSINQILVEVTTDITVASLTTAPSSNNTCLVNDTALAGAESTKWLGEGMEALQIDTIGSSISSLTGTIQVFENSGEYFLAYVDTGNNQIFPFRRGMAGSTRATLSNNGTLTLRTANYIFIDADGVTAYKTTIHPTYGPTDPASGTSGQFFYNTATGRWRKYTSSWSDANVHYIGFFICNTTQSVAAHSNDFAKNWGSNANGFMQRVDSDTIRVIVDSINIAGSIYEIPDFGQRIQLSVSGDRESGQSEDSNTTYYIYIDNTLKCRFSKTAPRAMEQRQALYHPYEYWRYLGYCVNDSGSNIGEVYWQATLNYFGTPSGTLKTGDIKTIFATTAESGWVALEGGTIGNPSSGATRANTDTFNLFKWLWERTSNTECALLTSGGTPNARGASAIADWEANRRLTVPDARGRTLIGIDGSAGRITSASTNGVNADTLGGVGGAQTHTLSIAEMPSHDHSIALDATAGTTGTGAVSNLAASNNSDSTGNTGGGDAHSNTQPWMAILMQMKL